ncbi:MAG TPA: HNH endonuclease [Flavobacterium sp.]|uniref:HNH endonuclease n=1 Tax=Flavobacterium sp. TaxID=239 RepID=UPI002F3F0191
MKDAKLKWKTDCWICGFNFTERYGNLGNDFIEIHHLIPISEGERETTIEDVRPVCSNCHRMIHKRKKMLTIQELKNIIEDIQKNKTSPLA